MSESEAQGLLRKQLELVVATTGIGMWDWDLDTNEVIYSPEWGVITGYAPDELPGTADSWHGMVHPDDRAAIQDAIERHVTKKTPYYQAEYRLRRKDGTMIWVRDKGTASEWHPDGRAKHLLGLLQDVTRIKEAEEARRGSQSLYDSNPNINIIFDENMQVIDCNPRALELYGFESKQAFIDGFLSYLPECVPPNMPQGQGSMAMEERLREVMELGETEFEAQLYIRGEEIPFSFLLRKILYRDGYAVVVYQSDLRRIWRAERNIERNDRLLRAVNQVAAKLVSADFSEFSNALGESLTILGRSVEVDRVYIWKNHEKPDGLYCSQIYEWSDGAEPQQDNEYTVDISYDEVIPSWRETLLVGKSINAIVRDLLPAERAHLEGQGIRSILILPIYIHSEFWGFIGFDDCTNERLFSETEESILCSAGLLLASATLRNRITVDLENALGSAQSASRAKGDFLSNMSHEIRTPLNAIVGMTELALAAEDSERKNECLHKIVGASRHLLGIINDILDMSKIEANKLELSPVEFRFERMLQKISDVIHFPIEEKSQQFSVELDPAIPNVLIADEQRLSQVITNLLSNAVKFTPEHGCISLRARLEAEESGVCTIRVEVSDNGIGISEEQQSRLFRSFEQAEHSTSRKYGGTGLGLAISRSIVEHMGGMIWIESEVGKGATFTFTVRAVRGQGTDAGVGDAAADTFSSEETCFAGRRVLLAEDVEINREIVLALLEPTLVTVDCAENGVEAVQLFREQGGRYDIIFMDVQMPEMDGYEATRAIRALDLPGADRVPIIAMTANVFREDIQKCIDTGMDDHLGKPLDFQEVLEKLCKHMPK